MFELKVEEDVELHSCFKYLLKGRLMCGKAYPVLKKEVCEKFDEYFDREFTVLNAGKNENDDFSKVID